jgi:poly-gamma-glutamate capsule biosynthesis protein CapA/YwtB (metallophosphatase superfamily)
VKYTRKIVVVLICFIFPILLVFFLISALNKETPKTLLNPKISELPTPIREFIPEKLTIEKLFNNDTDWITSVSIEDIRTLITTGDIIPARSVNYQTQTRNDPLWPYRNTANFLKNADITLVNLETPLIDKCPITQEGMIFCGNKNNIIGLVESGVDVANVANNHFSNYGLTGATETINNLSLASITVSGTDSAVFKDIRGLKFAFLGFNAVGVNPENEVIRQLNDVSGKADIIIVSFHWGEEYTSKPSKQQVSLAHLAIDQGADLIVGNHPHWIQPFELYKDRLIIYAHGNFIFDQMWSEKTQEGVVVKYYFYKKQLIATNLSPIKIRLYGQTYFLEGKDKEEILENMKKESLILEKL